MVSDFNSNNDFQYLKAKREERGLSLKDVFRRTRLSVNYLQAIENGDFHILPEPIYARNFIKTYARALGVDEKIILARYEDYLHSLNVLEDVPPEDIAPKAVISEIIARYRTFLGIITVLLVVFVVMWLVSMPYRYTSDTSNRSAIEKSITVASERKDSPVESEVGATVSADDKTEQKNKSAADDPGRQQQTPGQSAASVEQVSVKRTNTPGTIGAPQGVYEGEVSRLIIKATEETWIRMKTDQNPVFQVLLKPGDKVEYKAVVFDMDIGNAGGVKLQFKGKSLEDLGKSGEVIRLRLP